METWYPVQIDLMHVNGFSHGLSPLLLVLLFTFLYCEAATLAAF